MNVGKAIYYILSNATSVTDICGTRIFPEVAEQEAARPFVVYQITSVSPDDTNDGPAVIDEVSIDCNCIADTYNEAADLASVVRVALDRIRGTYNGVNIESVQFTNLDTEVDDDPRRYAQYLTFIVRVFRDAAVIATGQSIEELTLGRLYDVASNVTSEAIDRHALVYDEDSGEWIPRYPGEIRVINQSGETLLKGQLATAVGAQGDMVEVRPYNSQDDWRYLVGIATEEMVDGASGHVITLGEVRGLDTDQFNVGDLLYPTGLINALSPFGLTKFGETAGGPDNPLPIAMCTRSHANTGRIQVRMWTPGHVRQLAGLSDVYVPSPYVGAVLKYVQVGASYFWGYLPQTSKSILDGATEDVEIYYYAEGGDTQLDTNALSDTPSSGNKIVRKIWYATSSQADPDTGTWTLYQTLADNATFAQLQAAFEASLLVSPTGGQPVSIKTTWEDIPAFTGLLDTYSGASAAYSLRLLDSTYTGDAIRVRRASDNAEQDIGFDGTTLDTAALATFCAGTDGFVRTIYEQSGSGDDLTQTTNAAQGKIYDASTGVILDANGNPRIIPTAASQFYQGGPALDGTISVFTTTETAISGMFNLHMLMFFNGSKYALFARTASGLPSFAGITSIELYRDGSSWSPSNVQEVYLGLTGANHLVSFKGEFSNWSSFSLGSNYFSNGIHPFQELVVYPSDQSANRTGIETNINDYYSIY